MAFTTALTSSIGWMRFRLRDDRQETAFFSDDQLTQLITDAGTKERAVAEAARVLLMERARFASSEGVGEAGTAARVPGIDPAFTAYLRELIDMYGGSSKLRPIQITYAGASASDPV